LAKKKRIKSESHEGHIRALLFVSGQKISGQSNGEFSQLQILLLVDRLPITGGMMTGICSNMPSIERSGWSGSVLVGLAFVVVSDRGMLDDIPINVTLKTRTKR